MTNASGYNMYQKNKVMTASPAELTLMLYEGVIKFINVAIMGIDQKNIEKKSSIVNSGLSNCFSKIVCNSFQTYIKGQ